MDEAITLLQGSGLQKGSVIMENNPATEKNSVIRQKPEAGTRIREGDVVDIWVSGTETTPAPDIQD
jgi:beta-lactam-binding protein with PASTA domain